MHTDSSPVHVAVSMRAAKAGAPCLPSVVGATYAACGCYVNPTAALSQAIPRLLARLQRPLTSVLPKSSSIVSAAAHAAGEVFCRIAVGCALLAHHSTVGLGCVGQGRLALHAAEGLSAVHPEPSPATAGTVVRQRGCALTASITLDRVAACADMAYCTLPANRHRGQGRAWAEELLVLCTPVAV